MGWMPELYILSVLLVYSLLHSACSCPGFSNVFGNITEDQYLEVESELKIECRIFPDQAEKNHVSSKNLVLKFKGVNLPVTVVDKLTIEYVVWSSTINDTGTYNCLVQLPDYNTDQIVCSTYVGVGYKPLPVERFSCISEEFSNLTCTWKAPFNPIETEYKLYDYFVRLPTVNRTCPVVLNSTSCQYRLDTTPNYVQKQPVLYFILEGKNPLGSNKEYINLNHYTIVRPGVPKFGICTNITRNSLFMRWDAPKWLNYGQSPVPLLFQMQYYSTKLPGVKEINKIDPKELKITVSDLVPNTTYEFKIRVRLNLLGDDYFWSKFVKHIETTLPDVPYLAPEITKSAFDVQMIAGNRSITLYWKAVPFEYENGDNFHYVIRYHEHYVPLRYRRDMSTKPNYWVALPNRTSHTFEYLDPNSAYIFNLFAVNNEGNSTNETAIVIDKADRMLQGPKDIMIISYGEGNYSITWKDNNNNNEITHYTLFWCKTLKPRPAKCDGPIDWVHTTKTNHQLILPDNTTNYQFSVASNFNHQTSGMSWAPCIASHSGVLYKVKEVNLTPKNSTSLRVQWSLDCKAEERVIKKYLISYCPYEGKCTNNQNWKCENVWSNTTVLDASKTEYILTGLKPFTCYFAFMRILTNSGWSENSNFAYEETMPSAPSDSPRNIDASVLPVNFYNTEILLLFEPPTIPNGIITKYKIYYNDTSSDDASFLLEVSAEELEVKLRNYVYYYKNYSIEIAACVHQACSALSAPIYVFTGISTPSVITAPRVELSDSFVNISWDAPHFPNGPVDYYEVELYSNETDKVEHYIVNSSNSLALKRECNVVDPDESVYNFKVRGVNLDGDRPLYGNYSRSTKMVFCPSGKSMTFVLGAVIGIIAACVVTMVALVFLIHKCRREINARKNITVKLPLELETPFGNSLNSFDKLKNGLQKTAPDSSIPCDRVYERLCSFAQEGNQNEPGEWSEKDSASHRNNSGESNKSGVSSADTTRTIVSMDSSGEHEFSTGESPDPSHSDRTTPGDFEQLTSSLTPLFVNNSNNMAFSRCFVRPKPPTAPLIRFEDLGLMPPYCKFGEIPNKPLKSEENKPGFSATSFLESLYKINSEPSLCGYGDDVSEAAAMPTAQPYSKVGLARSNTHLNEFNRPNCSNAGYSRFGTAYNPFYRENNPQIYTVFVPPSGPLPPLLNQDKLPVSPKPSVSSSNLNPQPGANVAYSRFGVSKPPNNKDYVSLGGIASDNRNFKPSAGSTARVSENNASQIPTDMESPDNLEEQDDPRPLMEIMAADARICVPVSAEIDTQPIVCNGEHSLVANKDASMCNGVDYEHFSEVDSKPNVERQVINGIVNGLSVDDYEEDEEVTPHQHFSQREKPSDHYVSISDLAKRKIISTNSIAVNNNNNLTDAPVASV